MKLLAKLLIALFLCQTLAHPAPAISSTVAYKPNSHLAKVTTGQPATKSIVSKTSAPGGPLVETDPAFTNYNQWASSDYFLAQLNLDPERTLKRYGDGFAEQRLVDDQIIALTGRRFLSNYQSTEDEYMALLGAGVMYAKDFQLSPGVALSAEQMASLTTDIVWLETQTVVLPDGSSTQALVPTV